MRPNVVGEKSHRTKKTYDRGGPTSRAWAGHQRRLHSQKGTDVWVELGRKGQKTRPVEVWTGEKKKETVR